MLIGIEEVAFIIITILFGVLLGLFILQTIKRRRSATNLVLSLFFGFLACVFAIFSYMSGSFQGQVFQALQINVFGLQIFFFFLFFEQLRAKDISAWRLSIMLSLLIIQTLGLWLRINFIAVGVAVEEISSMLWFLSDMGYTIAGVLVYLLFSLVIYVRTYQYTREKKPLIICIALGMVGIGFLISFVVDLYDFLDLNIGILGTIAGYTIAFQALGLSIFAIIYLTDIDYLYRLPNDVFMVMVVTKTGIPLHTVKLKTRRPVVIETDLLSGLLSAINNVFEEIFKTPSSIQNISSEQIHLLMESGEKVVGVAVTDNISYFLDEALKRYTKEFEEKFAEELSQRSQDIADYYNAIELIKPVFPFFIVEKVIGS